MSVSHPSTEIGNPGHIKVMDRQKGIFNRLWFKYRGGCSNNHSRYMYDSGNFRYKHHNLGGLSNSKNTTATTTTATTTVTSTSKGTALADNIMAKWVVNLLSFPLTEAQKSLSYWTKFHHSAAQVLS